MPNTQTLQIKAVGLWDQYSHLLMPEGGLLTADNITIEREGIISPRRGFQRYNAVAFSSAPIQVMEYRQKLVVLDSTTLKYDNGSGTFTSWGGSFTKPTDAVKIHSIEAVQNLYFTTNVGVYKNSTISGTPSKAGTQQGLDIQLTQVGVAGWQTNNTQVTYKVLWIKKDANNYEVVGAPSWRVRSVNSSGSPVDITLTTTIPSEIVAGDYYEIYRSTMSVGVGVDSGEDCRLLRRTQIVSSDISGRTCTLTRAGAIVTGTLVAHNLATGDFVTISGADQVEYNGTFTLTGAPTADTFTYAIAGTPATPATGTINCKVKFVRFYDIYDESFLDDLECYTNSTQEGNDAGNFRPPLSVDLTYWKNCSWFANTQREQRKRIIFNDYTGITDEVSTLTFTGATAHTYTFSAAEAIDLRKFQRFTALGTAAENLTATIQSLVKVINRDPTNTEFVAYWESGENSAPGTFWIESISTASAVISIISSVGSKFDPVLPASGTTIVTENDDFQNRLYWSKYLKPEAVKLLTFFEVGTKDYPIERIIALRDSLIVLKKEGIWRITGDSEYTFSLQEIDLTCGILAPESAVKLGDRVYCITNKGVVRIDEMGAEVVSHPIENLLRPVTQFTNFRTLTSAIAYEGVSDNKYVLWTQSTSSDTYPTQAWVYNYLTGGTPWTKWKKSINSGIMYNVDYKLYLCHAVDGYLLKERKEFDTNHSDFSDEEIPITVTATGTSGSVSYVDVTYSYTGVTMAAGFLFRYSVGAIESRVMSVTTLAPTSFRLVLSDLLTLPATPFAASVFLPITAEVLYVENGGTVAITKRYLDLQLFMEYDFANTHKIATYTNRDPSSEQITYTIPLYGGLGWGLAPWGSSPWGSPSVAKSTPLRIVIPQQHRLAEELYIQYTHSVAKERFDIVSLSVTLQPSSSRTTRVR